MVPPPSTGATVQIRESGPGDRVAAPMSERRRWPIVVLSTEATGTGGMAMTAASIQARSWPGVRNGTRRRASAWTNRLQLEVVRLLVVTVLVAIAVIGIAETSAIFAAAVPSPAAPQPALGM